MEAKRNTLKCLAVGFIFLVVGFFASEAFSWGFATHAYIADHLGNTKQSQIRMIYDSVAPDTFNYLFAHPHYLGVSSRSNPCGGYENMERLKPRVTEVTCLRLRQP